MRKRSCFWRKRDKGNAFFLTSHAEIALSPTESQTTPSKSNAQTSPLAAFDDDDAIITVRAEEGVEVEKEGALDRRRAIASRWDEAPLRTLLLPLLSNEPIGDAMPECVFVLKRAPRGSIEGRAESESKREGRKKEKSEYSSSIEFTLSFSLFPNRTRKQNSVETMHGRPRAIPGAPIDPEKAKAAAQRVRRRGRRRKEGER